MKNFVLSLLLIVLFPIVNVAENSVFDNFDYYRVTTNYNGSAYNGQSILVYGDAGIIVRSLDGGENWTQINLDDSFRVMSMINIGNDYYGVFDNKYIIKSSDNEKTWEYFDYGITNFYKIIAYNNNLYCMSDSKIIVCNQSGDKIKEYPISIDTSYYDFAIVSDKLYYGSSKVRITEINLINDKTRVLHLTDYGVIYNDNLPMNLFTDGHTLFFNLKNNLYSFDGEKAKLVFSPIKSGLYQINNKELFELYNITFSTENIDSLYFIKINTNNGKPTRINKNINDRYISYLYFTQLNFITPDTIIAIGRNKLIYMSYDRGKTWELKSHFDDRGIGKIFMIDKKYSYTVGRSVKFIHTSDGGITWLPQKNYTSYFASENRFRNLYNYGTTFFKNNKFGFAFYHTLIQKDTNFFYTHDGGETINQKNSNEIIGYEKTYSPFNFKIIENNQQMLFIQPSQLYTRKFTMIFRLSLMLEQEKTSFIDSAQVVFIDTFDNYKLFALVINYKYPNNNSYDSIFISLMSSIDTAVTWQELRDYNILNDYERLDIVSRIDGNVFLFFKNKGEIPYDLFKLNIQTMELVKVFTLPNGFQPTQNGVQKVGNKYFISGYYYEKPPNPTGALLENDDFENNPKDWQMVTPKKRYNGFYLNLKNDSLIYFTSYDSLMQSNVIWFAKSKIKTSVENQIETNSNLYLSNPSPNPAKEKVRIKLYFNKRYKIEQANIKVYDILGNLVSQKNQFELNSFKDYSAFINWNCNSIKNGVYIISVELGGNRISHPVVIYK